MLAALLAGMLVLGVAPAASAHVHGITPLLELGCKVDNSITGANRVDSTPASAANGGPISRLIPAFVGNAPLGFGDGGFGAANDDVCP
jgi:hypothetical protein